MCETGNLIDLTGWDEPVKDETIIEETIVIESQQFKGPYDPFDSMEKEACIKGLHLKNEEHKLDIKATTDVLPSHYVDQDLNNETPPVAMELGQKHGDSLKSATAGGSESRPLKLQQLAKLNATRLSSLNAPIANQTTFGSYIDTSILTENLKMIAAESPVKLIEDEPNPIGSSDSVTELTALSDDTCSNMEFEARLKMLRIAMLNSPPKTGMEQKPTNSQMNTVNYSSTPGDVETLLQEFKSLVQKHVEISKREQFNVLIESLSAAIYSRALSLNAEATNQSNKDYTSTYKRQGTFDLDLQLQKKKADLVTGSSQNIEELPDLMTCSSATYDAESVDKPTSSISIEAPSPKASPDVAQKKPDSYLTEVVNENLAHQINELLERHNLTKMQLNDTVQHHYTSEHNETKSGGGGGGQTVILVVNSTAAAANQLPSCIVHPTATKLAGKENRDSILRRRSSSLSIHDKSKQNRPKSLLKQSSVESATNTSSQNVPHNKELSGTSDKLNVMTMTSFKQRRNSFSVGSIAGKTYANAASAAAAQSRALLSGRSKAGTLNESNVKCTVPTKANVPIKRVTPIIKPSFLSAEGSHLNTTRPRCNGQDTPMSSRANAVAGGQMFCTSTPMPQMRQMPRRSLKPVSSYSNTFAKKSTQ